MQILKRSLLIISILTLSCYFAQSQNSKLIDQVAAVVGDKIIMQSDVENQVLQLKAQGIKDNNMKCNVLNELINQKLLLIQAEKDSVQVSPNQVESSLERRLRYFIRQIGSQKKLEEYYNNNSGYPVGTAVTSAQAQTTFPGIDPTALVDEDGDDVVVTYEDVDIAGGGTPTIPNPDNDQEYILHFYSSGCDNTAACDKYILAGYQETDEANDILKNSLN